MSKTITITLDDDHMKMIKEIDTIFMGRPMKLEDDHIETIILAAIEESVELTRKMKLNADIKKNMEKENSMSLTKQDYEDLENRGTVYQCKQLELVVEDAIKLLRKHKLLNRALEERMEYDYSEVGGRAVSDTLVLNDRFEDVFKSCKEVLSAEVRVYSDDQSIPLERVAMALDSEDTSKELRFTVLLDLGQEYLYHTIKASSEGE